jgi:Flp pilus assembly pilin Flp
MKRLHTGGQSILEYALVLAAVIAVVVIALLGQGGIKDKVANLYNKAGNALANTTDDLNAGVFE